MAGTSISTSASCEVIRGAITSFIEDVNLIPSDINTRAKEFAAHLLLWTYNSYFKSLFTVKQWVITTGWRLVVVAELILHNFIQREVTESSVALDHPWGNFRVYATGDFVGDHSDVHLVQFGVCLK